MEKLLILIGLLSANFTFATHTITSCPSMNRTDMSAIFFHMGNDWQDLEDKAVDLFGYNLSNCLKKKVQETGDVRCKDLSGSTAGLAYPGNPKINIDTTYLGIINDSTRFTQKNRRACLAALMLHEYSHTCAAVESRADNIGRIAFEYWKDRFNLGANYTSCGFVH